MTRKSERELRRAVESLDDSTDDGSMTVTIRQNRVNGDGDVIERQQQTIEVPKQ